MGVDNYFIFDGVDCRQFAIHAFERSSYGADPIQYEARTIPGMDGDCLVSQDRYPNRNVSVKCLIFEDFYVNYERFRAWLMSKVGYFRLELGNHPGEFYLASVRNAIEPTVDRDANMGKFELIFSRKPQRFLKTGERVQSFTATGAIKNPTPYASKPLIRVYGTGEVDVGETTVTVTSADVYTDIDCEIMESYKGDTPKNQYVQFSTNDYPTLGPGANDITLGTGITRVEITPRWYIR